MPNDFFGFAGHVIDGQFHVIEIAGEGGFSVVYRGQHLTLREPVAIKCLKFTHKNEEIMASFKQRFFDESRIMYRLSQGNLNIVRAITTGVTVAPTTGAEVPYMVLEWLEGMPLSKVLKQQRATKSPGWSLEKVVRVFDTAALAVAHAHAQGVVHRDIKPGNLFLQSGSPPTMKVLDFGMAKVVSPETMGGLESAQTVAGVMVLSPQYVTPEQLDKAYGTVGPWTDVYSFALILIEAMTGRRARDAETFPELMRQMVDDNAIPTPRRRGLQVSDAVERIFARALTRDVDVRWQEMGSFWRELKLAAKREPDAPLAEPEDERTSVDMNVNLSGTRVMPSVKPPSNFGVTMPLQGVGTPASTPAPAQARSVSPRPFAARIRSMSPAPFQAPVEPSPPPPVVAPPAPAHEPEEEWRPPKPAGRGVWVTVFVLFILLSFGASGVVLFRLLRS